MNRPLRGGPDQRAPRSLRIGAIPSVLRRLAAEDDGQDLIEYGLLLGIIAAGLVALLPAIQTRMAGAYTNLSTDSNNLWIPTPP